MWRGSRMSPAARRVMASCADCCASGLGDVGTRCLRVHGGGLPPRLARRRRPRRPAAFRHQRRRALPARRRPARRVRGDAGAGRCSARPGRLTPHDRRRCRVHVRRPAADGDGQQSVARARGPGARRRRRCDDVHQRAATDPGLVPRWAGAAGDPADRAARAGGPDRRRVPARRRAACGRMDADLRHRGRRRPARGGRCGRRSAQRSARGDDGRGDRTAGCAAGVVAGARHPPRSLDPLRDRLLGQHVRAVLGLPLSRAGPRPLAGCRRRPT